MDLKEIITISPDIQHGQPVFKGTRVPIETLFDHLEASVSLNEFLEDFPSVSKEQAIATLVIAKDVSGRHHLTSGDCGSAATAGLAILQRTTFFELFH